MRAVLLFCLLTSFAYAKKVDREITVVNYEIEGVKQWHPGMLMAKKGETVEITLINKAKAPHGFFIPAFKVREVIKKDEKKKISFTADKAGLFEMKCHMHPAHVGGQIQILD